MADQTTGRKAVMGEAVEAASAEVEARCATAEQVEMFDLPTRFEGDEAEQQRNLAARGQGSGRPAGAQNKSTAEFRRFFLETYGSPLQAMMRWMRHTPETLALELGCSKLEAFDRLTSLWKEIAPYLHGKAVPTDDKGQAVPLVMMQFGDQTNAAGPSRPPWEAMVNLNGEVVDLQQLSEADDASSHDDPSHNNTKPMTNND